MAAETINIPSLAPDDYKVPESVDNLPDLVDTSGVVKPGYQIDTGEVVPSLAPDQISPESEINRPDNIGDGVEIPGFDDEDGLTTAQRVPIEAMGSKAIKP